jgi:uncharacterized membrane protein
MQGLGSLKDLPKCQATSVSGDGSFVSGFCSGPTVAKAFRWDAGSGMQGLGVPTGDTESFAYYISEDGAVVTGESDRGAGTRVQLFRWNAADGIVGLGVLPGLDSCQFSSLSGDGSAAAGFCIKSSQNPVAFVWDAQNGIRNLRSVLIDAGNDLTDWILSSGPAISTDGLTLAGTGYHAGRDEAWVAPEASATGEGVVALALLGLGARRARARRLHRPVSRRG